MHAKVRLVQPIKDIVGKANPVTLMSPSHVILARPTQLSHAIGIVGLKPLLTASLWYIDSCRRDERSGATREIGHLNSWDKLDVHLDKLGIIPSLDPHKYLTSDRLAFSVMLILCTKSQHDSA